jgi:hypothetical protein
MLMICLLYASCDLTCISYRYRSVGANLIALMNYFLISGDRYPVGVGDFSLRHNVQAGSGISTG